MNRVLLLLLFPCLFCGIIKAQDPVFSQFYAAPIQTNPAFVGTTFEPRIALNYRNQWSNIANAYVTYAGSYEQFFSSLNSGIGVMVMADAAGDGLYNTTRATLTYGYQVNINNDFFLKGGIEAGIGAVSLDWERLIFLDQIDPIDGVSLPTDEVRPFETNRAYFDISAGLLVYSSKFYAGFSAKHLNTPDETILSINDNINNGLPMRLNFHGGTQIKLKRYNNKKHSSFISPNIMYVHQGEFNQVNGGAYAKIGPIFGGLWYRHAFSNPDAAIFLVGVQQGIVKIGYSYDLTISELGFDTGGTHEISFMLNFDNSKSLKRQRQNRRYEDCFEIFR